MSSIQLGEKRVEIWLQTIDQPFNFSYGGEILEYADPIEWQYVLRVEKTS